MKVRRVVTAKDEKGKSVVKWDSEIDSKLSRPGSERVEIWATKSLPAEMTEEDPTKWELPISLGSGSICRIVRYQPGVEKLWHSTETIDYGIVLQGEMWMQLEKGEVHLRAGDVVVQRGVNHNWVNRGDQVCIMVFVLIATEGAKSTGWKDSK